MPTISENLRASLSGGLEENVLTALCWSSELAPLIASRVDHRIFSSRTYRRIAQEAIQHLEQYNQPARAHMMDRLEREILRGDAGVLMRETLGNIQQLAPELQADFVLNQLDTFIAVRQLSQSMEEAADALQQYDLPKAREALNTPINDRAGLAAGTWMHDPEQVLAFLDRGEYEVFSSGIQVLDDMDVTPRRKETMLMLGRAKSGKTWFLIQLGKANVMRRKKILHITLEVSEAVIARRYIQALWGMTKRESKSVVLQSFKRDERGTLLSIDEDSEGPVDAEGIESVDRRVLIDRVNSLKRRPPILIKQFPTNQLTLSHLTMYINWLHSAYNFEPDMLILDYPDLMALNVDNLRVSTTRLIHGLRGLCVDRNIAGVFVSQGHRAAYTAHTVHGGMVAEDYAGKIGGCDTVLTYSQTKAERDRMLARVGVDAARDSVDKFTVLITQNYTTGQFCLDSVYMSAQVEAVAKRVTTGQATDDDED